MKPVRILVVDDDDHVRDALVDELGATYRVEAVASGSEAFDALATQRYDVIISDLKMPDHDGIEVLEFARVHQRDAIRVLLTGYLDERAQRALMQPDAPYKVGKPWHDEIEVVVRRGLEQRELARRLSASVEDALALATIDEELEHTKTALELSETVVRRALTVEGVGACATVVRDGAGEHRLVGGMVPRDGGGWVLDLPLDWEGELRLLASGVGESARQLVSYLAHRAQRRCGVIEANVRSIEASVVEGTRMNQLMRQATLGALTTSLLHDLASTMQTLSSSLAELHLLGAQVPGMADALAEASTAGDEAIQLFVQMRKLIRAGTIARRPVSIDGIVRRASRLASGYVGQRAQLRVAALPDAQVLASEHLFSQVLVNLLRNAANASPPGGMIDVVVRALDAEVTFAVVDDGPGVAPEICDVMFEPFASGTHEGTGLGLAISAYIVKLLGGRLSYRREPERGACFLVALPRCTPAAGPGQGD